MDPIPPALPVSRPTIITVLCIIGFIGAVLVIPMALTSTAKAIGPWYPPYLVLSGAIGLACNIGFWKMKRWAVFAYIAFLVVNQVIMLSTGIWRPAALIIPGAFIAIIGCYFKRMS